MAMGYAVFPGGRADGLPDAGGKRAVCVGVHSGGTGRGVVGGGGYGRGAVSGFCQGPAVSCGGDSDYYCCCGLSGDLAADPSEGPCIDCRGAVSGGGGRLCAGIPGPVGAYRSLSGGGGFDGRFGVAVHPAPSAAGRGHGGSWKFWAFPRPGRCFACCYAGTSGAGVRTGARRQAWVWV